MRLTLCEVELANIGFRSGVRCSFWQKSARATDSLWEDVVGGLATEGGGIDCHLREPSRNYRNQQFERGNPPIEKLYIFWNKA
jgi:hypothetical protein